MLTVVFLKTYFPSNNIHVYIAGELVIEIVHQTVQAALNSPSIFRSRVLPIQIKPNLSIATHTIEMRFESVWK